MIVTTIKGLEEITIQEIKEKLKVKAKKITDGRVSFESKKNLDLKSVDKIYELIKEFKFKSKKEILDKVKKLKFDIKKDFVVRCYREGKHKFSSNEIERNIGEIIHDKGFKVNLKSKNVIYVETIKDHFFIGYLLKNRLCKRDYRLRISRNSINGCLGYCLLKLSDYKKNEVLVDPLCQDGTVLIEAGLFGGKKIYGLDNNPYNLKNSEVNSKLAKVKINLIEANVDLLNTKFKKESVDKMITSLFVFNKNKKQALRVLDDLLSKVKYVLKKRLVMLSNENLEIYFKKYKELKLKKKYSILNGMYKIYILEI